MSEMGIAVLIDIVPELPRSHFLGLMTSLYIRPVSCFGPVLVKMDVPFGYVIVLIESSVTDPTQVASQSSTVSVQFT